MSDQLEIINGVMSIIRKQVEAKLFEIETFEDRPVQLQEIRDLLKHSFESANKRLKDTKNFTLSDAHYKNLEYRLSQRAVDVDEKHKTLGLYGSDIKPWLSKTPIEWRFWERYKANLKNSGISTNVIKEHQRLLDMALDHTGNPKADGSWSPRKGLVMGNVQAGKTMNFIGLINKALDVGYHTIVVMGGHMDELRNQAQSRIDAGIPEVDEMPKDEQRYVPTHLTTVDHDFIAKHASATAPNLIAVSSVTVMKKNTKILDRFMEWISKRGQEVFRKPFLLIDDEADYASINTKHAQEDYTSTNTAIRKLLNMFDKPTYIAYTATPFANVFIPFRNTTSGEFDDDLFPSDFMLKMPIPPNYKGQDFFFPDRDREPSDPTRLIKCIDDDEYDYGNNPEDWLPLKHKKDAEVNGLHEQLEDALYVFFLVTAIRYLRGDTNAHNTMLVNVTRFNDVQVIITEKIDDFVNTTREQLEAFGALPLNTALSNSPVIRKLKSVYEEEFTNSEFEFQQVLEILVAQSHRIKVEMVNRHSSNKKRKGLDYDSYSNEGYWVIAVGGLKLSRGLTLEGLSVSFFLRNAGAYDTLTQMCRWFGYRDGYSDLCRLYLLPQSFEHYSTVAQSIRELYDDLRIMQASRGRPRDFGLKVRSSDTALLITAKNKMGSGEKIDFNYRLWGESYGRIRAWCDEDRNEANYGVIEDILERIKNENVTRRDSEFGKSVVYENVPYNLIYGFIERVDAPISGKKNEPQPIIDALKALDREEFTKPKLIIYSRNSPSNNPKLSKLINSIGEDLTHQPTHILSDIEVFKIARTFTSRKNQGESSYIFTGSSSIGDSDDLKNIFTKSDLEKFEFSNEYSNRELRSVIPSPVLIVYLLSAVVSENRNGPYSLTHNKKPTVMYMLHFPTSNGKKIEELDVNKQYLVNEVLRSMENDDINDEDAEG